MDENYIRYKKFLQNYMNASFSAIKLHQTLLFCDETDISQVRKFERKTQPNDGLRFSILYIPKKPSLGQVDF